MSGKQKQRTKGNVKPSSSARTAELMARESGGAMGFIGFGTMSGDLGYVPHTSDADVDSKLDGDFRMLLRKLTKKDSVTKLKTLQDFAALCKEKDQEIVSATLPHWARMYGRLAIDHDKRVREATQQTFQQLAEQVKRNLAPHLRNLMGPWILAQCDTFPPARANAKSAFNSAFPAHKQAEAIGFCSVQVIQYLHGNLFKETPTTLSDANTTSPEEQEEKYLWVISTSMLALGLLVTMVTEKSKDKVEEELSSMMGEGKLWKMGKHKSPMVRNAFYTLLGALCKHVPTVAETHLPRISSALLGSLDEADSYSVVALWDAVLILVSQHNACWTHVNPRKAVLPKLWSFLRCGGQGSASTIFPGLLPFLSQIPDDVIGDGMGFYGEFFGHFKTGLCSDKVSKSLTEFQAIMNAYMECLRYAVSRNLDIEDHSIKVLNMLLEDHVLLLIESSIKENNSNLATTSLYPQTATLISYLQKQTSDDSNAGQAAQNILKMLWANLTKLCLSQTSINPPDVSVSSLQRITYLLQTLAYPDVGLDFCIGLAKDHKVHFDVLDKPCGVPKDDQMDTSKDQTRPDLRTEEQIVTNMSTDLLTIVRQLTNASFTAAKSSESISHLEFLSGLIEIFPISAIFKEILFANSCLESNQAKMESSDSSNVSVVMIDHEAAMDCFTHVLLPWLVRLDADGLRKESGFMVDMVYVVLQRADVSQKAAIVDEVCCSTRSPLVLHQLVKKIHTAGDSAFLRGCLKSAKFGNKVVELAETLCHMTGEDQSDIRNQSWYLISLGLSTDTSGEPRMDAVYAEKVLLTFTEALQSSKVEGHQEEADNAISFICDIASHFFSDVEGCMVIKATEKLLFAIFQISCSESATLSESLQSKLSCAWQTGVKVLVKQTGGLITEDGFLHKIGSWIKAALFNSTNSLHRCNSLAQAAYSLCMTVQSSLPESPEDASCQYVIEALLAIMLIGEDEWVLHDQQLPNKWQISALLNGSLTYSTLPCTSEDTSPCTSEDTSASDKMPTSLVWASFVASLLGNHGDCNQRLPWRFSFMGAAILEMTHALEWCRGMMGLKPGCKVARYVASVSQVPAYCQYVAHALETALDTVLQTLNQEEWNILFGKVIDKSFASGGLWALSLGQLLSTYESSTAGKTETKCNIYDMLGGPDRLSDMSENYLHTLECVIPYLTTDEILEILQINTAVLITSDTSVIPNVNGGLGLLAVITRCCLHPQWHRITQYDLIITCLEQLSTWRDTWEQGFLFNCNLFEADAKLIPINTKILEFVQQVVERIPSSLSSHHWDFVLCSLVSWVQSCTENIQELPTNPAVAALCCAVCDLLTSVDNLLSSPSVADSNLPGNLATEWKEFFSEAAFSVMLPMLIDLIDELDLNNLDMTQYCLLQSLCEAVSHTPTEHLLEHKLSPKLTAGSWLPDNLQTLTNTLCPLMMQPQRCIQLAAFEMLARVLSSTTKHDEEHLQNSSKDEEEVTLAPPAPLKVLLDSSEVLMETLLGDVAVGECVTMEPGSEAYHDTLMYILGWRLYLTIFKAASAEVRAAYATYMRENKKVGHLLENLFCLMPHVPTIQEPSKELSSKSSTKAKQSQVTMFTDSPRLQIKDGTPSSAEIQHQACAVYSSSLEELPAMVRQWWNSQDKRIAPLVDRFTSKYVSPVLCNRELQDVQCQPKAFDNMTVKARPVTQEVIATYAVEELSMDLVIHLAANHPLGVITVDSGKRVGVSQSQWRNWMLQLTTFLTHQNGSILDGLKLWKRNVDKRFEGVDDCMVCFSVIHGSNYSLPKLTCKTCKKKFHSACLYKWFSTSNQSTCPLCRSPY